MAFNDAYQALIDFDLNERKKKREKKETSDKDSIKHDETKKSSDSKSPKPKVATKKEKVNYDIPSRQFGDLYCIKCDSHMNSEQMWEAHIAGKRHLRKFKNADSDENIHEYRSAEPIVQKELDEETRPIAGLDHLCEILHDNLPPTYQCFLCCANFSNSRLLIEHITGLKHQMAFLKEHDKEKYSLVDSSALSKSYLEPIVQDLISKYEMEHGRGKMSVKKEKKPESSISYKKSCNDGVSKTSRYSPPTKSSRYSPPSKISRYSPPKYSRHSLKANRVKERNSESEWKRVSPVRERSRERRYSERSLHSDEENWKKIESTCYRRAPTDLATDSRWDQTYNYNHAWPPSDTGRNCNDLRVVLEQKKSLGMTSSSARANMDVLASAQVSSEINSVSDSLLHLVDDMSPEVFLSLALFKLDNMYVKEDLELKLLDRVANKATSLALDIKKKLLAPDLKAKYQEALAQNGISPQDMVGTSTQNNVEFTQNLDNLIGHYKARKTTMYEDVHSKDSYSDCLISSEHYNGDRSSHRQLNTSPQYRNTPERAPIFESGWNQRSPTSLPFQSFSSTPTNIPGLTLTEEQPAQPSTVLSQFAQAAQDIFGNINVPSTSSNPYHSEDYKHFNYRY